MANKRRTPQEIVLGLKEQIRKLEAQSREREKAADAAKQRRLVDMVKRAGLYDEPEDVILGILIKAHTSLQDPERGEAVRSEARGIAAFGDPATLDGMIQRALQPVVGPVETDSKPGSAPEGFEAPLQRPPAGSLVAVAPDTMSTHDAAYYTGWSTSHLVNEVKGGRLYAVKVPYHQTTAWRFHPLDLDPIRKRATFRPSRIA